MCKKYNMENNFTPETVNKIISLYANDKISATKISKQLNTSVWSVLKCLRQHNIQIRSASESTKKYKIDETFFEVIDTAEKAYWLGWMFADGCVSSSSYGLFFHITLHEKDKIVLEEFQKALKTNTPIHQFKKKNQYGLYIWSKKMRQDLIRLGCTPKKSLTLEFPKEDQVPKQFLPSLIHGYFDGDGNINFSPKNCRIEAKITSSVPFCDGYMHFLSEAIGVKKFYITRRFSKFDKTEYQGIGFGKFDAIKRFKDLIYKNERGLERKRVVFLKAEKWRENK